MCIQDALLFLLNLAIIPTIMRNMRMGNIMYHEYAMGTQHLKMKLEKGTAIFIIGVIFLCLFMLCTITNTKLAINEVKPLTEEYENNVVPEEYPIFLEPIVPITNPISEEVKIKPELMTAKSEVTQIIENTVVEPTYKEDMAEDTKGNIDNDSKEDIEQTPGIPKTEITYQGSLRTDYCIGSEVDISSIRVYKTVKEEVTEISLEDCVIGEIDTTSAGEKELVIKYESTTLSIPYRVVEYKVYLDGNGGVLSQTEVLLENYKADLALVGSPEKLGKEFVGWYRDVAGIIPFERAEQGETALTLYAKYQEWPNIMCDENGYIVGYTGGAESIIDFVLNIPRIENVKGIGNDPFAMLGDAVLEVYIPNNIEYIDLSAFDSLPYLFYIEVSSKNPVYYSKFGIVYDRETDEVVIYPNGQLGIE